MKISKVYVPVVLFAVLVLGILLGTILDFPNKPNSLSSKDKIDRLLQVIGNEYVDSVATDTLVDKAISQLLQQLDPHSVYINASEMTQVSEELSGNFVGIGISFMMLKDTVTVTKTLDGGPALAAGLKAGDKILFEGKNKLYGRKLATDSLFKYLKGEPNSEVRLKVFRKSQNKILNFQFKRKQVHISSIEAEVLLPNRTAYIKISKFAEDTAAEFSAALKKLLRQGATSLIIDLRGNGGGYMEQAVSIADELLQKDLLIVYTKAKDGKKDSSIAKSGGLFEKGKLSVLIDEYSASASEIIAGAIQDNDRGTIIGRRSFGKGLVQREIGFEDGSAVRLTIARYYTPTGRSIQGPYSKGTEAYYESFEDRLSNGELFVKDSIKLSKLEKFKTPKGKIVYGGGGIVPDVFVALDSNLDKERLLLLLQSPIPGNFLFEKWDSFKYDRSKIAALSVNERLVTDFITYANENGFELKTDASDRARIGTYLQAEKIRLLQGDTAYWQFILPQIPMIQAAGISN